MIRAFTILLLASSPLCAQGPELKGNTPEVAEDSWRARYELGPGDVINLSLFGRPELDRNGFRIAPDGTISYLQAQSVKVQGLSINEARTRIEKELQGHYRSPRVIITPSSVGSKQFMIMGKVIKRGTYTLEHPITLVEAVAQAGGIETGLFERRTVELADLDRSFISRKGKQLPVDFRKLFHDGDMTLNIGIEPNDYIFIASSINNDYYVLGAVKEPGVQGLTPDASVIAAISRRGGFTDRAWTEKILVIRGSLTEPEAIEINVKDILSAKTRDMRIQPRDIIFVADKPWAGAQDIMNMAISTFISSATSNWINLNIDPVLTPP